MSPRGYMYLSNDKKYRPMANIKTEGFRPSYSRSCVNEVFPDSVESDRGGFEFK